MEQLYCSPGQQLTLFLEVSDGYYNRRVDSILPPVISRVVLPDLSLAEGFPQEMTRFDIGLYYFQYTIPTGAIAVGSYLVDGYYNNPIDGLISNKSYQVIVDAPFGIYSATAL